MSKFGQGRPAGTIGPCAQCHNKAEVAKYPGDNPEQICEKCHLENMALERKIGEVHGHPAPTFAPPVRYSTAETGGDPERELYLRVISEGATEDWVEDFIKEVLTKNVLKYDWKQIIRSERWFSILDLRRFALDINPDFEKDRPAADASVDDLMGEDQPVVKKRRNKKQQGA